MEAAAKYISEKYGCAVLCKGGHQVNDADDLLWRDGFGKWFHGKRIDNPNTHGTGCTLSSAIASNLAKGYDLDDVRGAGQGIHLRRTGGHAGSGPRLRPHEPHVRPEGSFYGMITSTVAILFAVGYLLATVWLCRGIRLDGPGPVPGWDRLRHDVGAGHDPHPPAHRLQHHLRLLDPR